MEFNETDLPIELSGERGKLGCLEVLWKHLSSKLFLLVNDKRPSVGQPCDSVGIFIIAQDLHQL